MFSQLTYTISSAALPSNPNMLLGRERREENRGTKDKVEEEERQRKKGEKGKQSTYLFSNPFSSNYRCRVSLSEARFQDENDTNKVRLEGSYWHDLASFLGPAQLSVACSTEKWGEPGIFSHVSMTESASYENLPNLPN